MSPIIPPFDAPAPKTDNASQEKVPLIVCTLDKTDSGPGCPHFREAFLWLQLGYGIAHLWIDEHVYAAAIKRDDPITDEEALAWLDRAHRREVPIRPFIDGVMIDVDPLEPAAAPEPGGAG